ncbi:MAG: hypothetical protein ACK5OB_01150 [Pirellula sp.]|jgi:hypothetical protein
MFDWLFENIWLVGGLGLFAVGLAVFAWIQTGHPWALRTAAGLGVLTVLLIAMNLWVETEREELLRTLYGLADDLQANRTDRVLAQIHPEASPQLNHYRDRLREVRFHYAKIKKIHGVEIGPSRTPRTAVVRLNAMVEGEQSGMRGTVPRWVRLRFEKENGKWLIVDCEDREPQYEMLNQQGRDRLDSFRRR